MCDQTSGVSRLRYIDAHHVQSSGACLDRLDVREGAGQQIGRLDGVIVDVEARRVRYFVVHSGTWLAPHWQVLPFFSARLDRNNWALRVDFDRTLAAPFSKLDRDALPKFADDDQTTGLFEPAPAEGDARGPSLRLVHLARKPDRRSGPKDRRADWLGGRRATDRLEPGNTTQRPPAKPSAKCG
jgi:hypothetical protein